MHDELCNDVNELRAILVSQFSPPFQFLLPCRVVDGRSQDFCLAFLVAASRARLITLQRYADGLLYNFRVCSRAGTHWQPTTRKTPYGIVDGLPLPLWFVQDADKFPLFGRHVVVTVDVLLAGFTLQLEGPQPQW